jgi:hypothetical protein
MFDENAGEMKVSVVKDGKDTTDGSMIYSIPWYIAPEAKKDGLLAVLFNTPELDDHKYLKHIVGLPENPKSMDMQIHVMGHKIV